MKFRGRSTATAATPTGRWVRGDGGAPRALRCRVRLRDGWRLPATGRADRDEKVTARSSIRVAACDKILAASGRLSRERTSFAGALKAPGLPNRGNMPPKDAALTGSAYCARTGRHRPVPLQQRTTERRRALGGSPRLLKPWRSRVGALRQAALPYYGRQHYAIPTGPRPEAY